MHLAPFIVVPVYESEVHYLRVYIGHLQRKLEPDLQSPRRILTEAGKGYRLEL